MMWILFEILVNLFESILILHFTKSRLQIRNTHRFADAICVCSCTLFYSMYLYFNLPVNDVVIFMIPFIYALFTSGEPWYLCSFWIATLAILFTSSIGVASHIYILLTQKFDLFTSNSQFFDFTHYIFANTVLFIVIHFASRLNIDPLYTSWRVLISFLLISLGILLAEETLYFLQNSVNTVEPLVFAFGYLSLLFCTLLSILLFQFVTDNYHRLYHYESETLVMKATQKHQLEFRRMYDDFISKQHDFKQQLDVLDNLLSREKNSVAREHLCEYKASLSHSQMFFTGNLSVDALLTAKYLTMKDYGIEFHYSPYPLDNLPVSTIDFCSIVGNLLDNAIEGVVRMNNESRVHVIILSFARSFDMFHIVCKNSFDCTYVKNKGGRWISSKENIGKGMHHGLGIPNIKRIVNAAEGHCLFSAETDYFVAEIALPYIQK